MTFGEKSSWAVIASVGVSFAWYVASVSAVAAAEIANAGAQILAYRREA